MSVTDSTHTSELAARAKEITERELVTYSERTQGSQKATERARKVLPAGVPSSFQAYDPHPIVVKHAAGAHMVDVDDNEYVDYDMGFGALFAGHMHPAVRKAVEAQLDHGSLYVTPCELDAEVAELLGDRYGFPMWRPTNSGTEATMDAIRLARGVTKREKLVKVEGGYHGHHDEVMVSNKPAITDAGPADAPFSVPQSAGITQGTIDDVIVIPYNDAPALERVLASREVACFIVEPVMENIGICLPEPGYLQAVREICDKYGTLLIFDEVKTGITAGYGGATKQLGVTPDLITFAKGVTSGYLPLSGVIVSRAVCEELEEPGFLLRTGYTYSGHHASCAAGIANLQIMTDEGLDQRANHVGEKLQEGLRALAADGHIESWRGMGAVYAAELGRDSIPVRNAILEEGVIVRPIGTCLAICPPLVITDDEIGRVIDTMANALR